MLRDDAVLVRVGLRRGEERVHDAGAYFRIWEVQSAEQEGHKLVLHGQWDAVGA